MLDVKFQRVRQFDGEMSRKLSAFEDAVAGAFKQIGLQALSRLRATDLKTANYVAQLGEIVLCNAPITVTLPTATPDNQGQHVVVVPSDVATVTSVGSQVQRGAATSVSSTTLFLSDGTDWWALTSGDGTGFLSVKAFGARGDGVTDDTAAFQAAINYFIVNNRPGTLYVPRGVYLVTSTLTIQGNAYAAIRIQGEIGTTASFNDTTILFGGAAGTKGVFDLKGANGTVLSHMQINGQGQPKYIIWIRPDQVLPLGAENIYIEHCSCLAPQNVSGSACIAVGPESGSPTQASEIYIEHCHLTGNTNVSWASTALINLAGGNAKDIFVYNSRFDGHAYGTNLEVSSGPVTFIACGWSNNYTAAIRAAGSRIMCIGCNIETNAVGCKIVNGPQGGGDGNVKFVGCELSAVPANDDLMFDYWGGTLEFDHSLIFNLRQVAVSNATNASPIVLTVPTGHGITAGDKVTVQGVGGNLAANNAAGTIWTVSAATATTITLQGSTGSGAYTTGGTVYPEPKVQIGSPIPGGALDTLAAAVVSRNSRWWGVADVIPVFDRRSPGTRMMTSTYCQAHPHFSRSEGDTGVMPGVGSQTQLQPVYAHTLQMLPYAAGVLATNASGVIAPQTATNVTGSRGGNAALASLLTALAGKGIITDSTSP